MFVAPRVDIPISLRIEVPYRSIPTRAHATETFQRSIKVSGRIGIQDPFTHRTSLDLESVLLTSAFRKVTPQKQKPFNPVSSTPSPSTNLTSPASAPSKTLNYNVFDGVPF